MTDHATTVQCPLCLAAPDQPCRTRGGLKTSSHRARLLVSPEGVADMRLRAAASAGDPADLRERALEYFDALMGPRGVYMAHANSAGSVFVKSLTLFASQGGFHQAWGRAWSPVVAVGLEDARREGCRALPLARPYERQTLVALRAVEGSETPG